MRQRHQVPLPHVFFCLYLGQHHEHKERHFCRHYAVRPGSDPGRDTDRGGAVERARDYRGFGSAVPVVLAPKVKRFGQHRAM
jgi:hypothetical protein